MGVGGVVQRLVVRCFSRWGAALADAVKVVGGRVPLLFFWLGPRVVGQLLRLFRFGARSVWDELFPVEGEGRVVVLFRWGAVTGRSRIGAGCFLLTVRCAGGGFGRDVRLTVRVCCGVVRLVHVPRLLLYKVLKSGK